MNATTRQTKINAAHKQIEILQAEKARIADGWLARGLKATDEMLAAVSDQIISLYEEIDALEAGEAKVTETARCCDTSDEIGVSKAELEAVAHLGWGPEQVIKQKRRMLARVR